GSAPRCAPAARDLLWRAAIAENGSEHPLGRPIVAAAGELGAVPQPDGFEAVTGRGVRAQVDEATVEIGSVTALAEWGIPMVEPAAAAVERVTTDGGTALVVAVDSQVAGVIGVAGAPR